MIITMDVLEILQLGQVLYWMMMMLTNKSDRAELDYSYNFQDLFTIIDYSEASFYTWNHVEDTVK